MANSCANEVISQTIERKSRSMLDFSSLKIAAQKERLQTRHLLHPLSRKDYVWQEFGTPLLDPLPAAQGEEEDISIFRRHP